MDYRSHWNQVYSTKSPQEVSWYQPHAEQSLTLIERIAAGRPSRVIDVGGGASTLVDDLLVRPGFEVTVLDLSSAALQVARQRLGEAASSSIAIASSTDIVDVAVLCDRLGDLQQLMSFGLLRGAFRPTEKICAMRSLARQRAMLLRSQGRHVQHMQKAMTQMNLQLANVISDIAGETGQKIVRGRSARQPSSGKHEERPDQGQRGRNCPKLGRHLAT